MWEPQPLMDFWVLTLQLALAGSTESVSNLLTDAYLLASYLLEWFLILMAELSSETEASTHREAKRQGPRSEPCSPTYHRSKMDTPVPKAAPWVPMLQPQYTERAACCCIQLPLNPCNSWL